LIADYRYPFDRTSQVREEVRARFLIRGAAAARIAFEELRPNSAVTLLPKTLLDPIAPSASKDQMFCGAMTHYIDNSSGWTIQKGSVSVATDQIDWLALRPQEPKIMESLGNALDQRIAEWSEPRPKKHDPYAEHREKEESRRDASKTRILNEGKRLARSDAKALDGRAPTPCDPTPEQRAKARKDLGKREQTIEEAFRPKPKKEFVDALSGLNYQDASFGQFETDVIQNRSVIREYERKPIIESVRFPMIQFWDFRCKPEKKSKVYEELNKDFGCLVEEVIGKKKGGS
jgi:hypothetical protein